MEYTRFTYVDESVCKTIVWNIAALHILMKMYIQNDNMEYSSFTYVDDKKYKTTIWNITVFEYFDENVYKTTIWNIAIFNMLMKMYIKRQYGILLFYIF